MKELTEFGKYCRILRIKNGQTMTETAKLLGVSLSYISSIEHGDRKIPVDWRNKIIKIYDLKDNEIVLLDEAISKSPRQCEITIEDIKNAFVNMLKNEEIRNRFKNMLEEYDNNAFEERIKELIETFSK